MSIAPPDSSTYRTTALTVVVVCFVFGLVGRGLGETFTVFLLPLDGVFGQSRGALAGVYSVALLAAGVGAPVAGLAFDRVGPRWLYLAGLSAAVLGIGLAGYAKSLWQLYICLGLLVGGAGAALGNVPNAALLSRWFKRRLGAAIGLVYSSMGIGTLLMVPYAQFLVDRFDWQGAYHRLGLTVLVLVPLAFLLPWRRIAAGHPDLQPSAPAAATADFHGRTLRSAVRMLPFWSLIWVFSLTGVGMFTVLVQLVAYLIEIGFAPLKAASAYGFAGMLTPVGMIGFGWITDRVGRRRAAGASYMLTVLGFVGLLALGAYRSDILLGSAMICLGLSMGSRGPIISMVAARLFHGPNFGAIFGTIVMGGGIGSAGGALIGGLLYDWTGGYTAGLYFGIVVVLSGSLPFWLVPELARR